MLMSRRNLEQTDEAKIFWPVFCVSPPDPKMGEAFCPTSRLLSLPDEPKESGRVVKR